MLLTNILVNEYLSLSKRNRLNNDVPQALEIPFTIMITEELVYSE